MSLSDCWLSLRIPAHVNFPELRQALKDLDRTGGAPNEATIKLMQESQEIDGIIYSIGQCFLEANASLLMFNQSLLYLEQEFAQRHAELHTASSPPTSGLPFGIVSRMPITHAHTFLSALDMIGKLLNVMSKHDRCPDNIKDIYDSFKAALPSISEIRNSAQHLEDRLLRHGKQKGKTHVLLTVPLILGDIKGNQLVYTLGDNTVSALEISLNTLRSVYDIVQRALDAFPSRTRIQLY